MGSVRSKTELYGTLSTKFYVNSLVIWENKLKKEETTARHTMHAKEAHRRAVLTHYVEAQTKRDHYLKNGNRKIQSLLAQSDHGLLPTLDEYL